MKSTDDVLTTRLVPCADNSD